MSSELIGGSLLLGFIIYFVILEIATILKYGISRGWLMYRCFIDHWKGWLIFLPFPLVAAFAFMFYYLNYVK